ncbi:hypothetical protein [Qingshengfaniella alkalisoli]|uniref:Uncharacterized protein n=1 Tax=Qingshengfaniella alkalisoli TaxID=2599296 RepID=A0A5B8J8A1_9RHOB|nr:hypothetical protein [Qingshengfaniella alkalisoli]QDY70687.1 hypothetical protein FPZ52_13490 [Qingshengfaniella alkalisoli]
MGFKKISGAGNQPGWRIAGQMQVDVAATGRDCPIGHLTATGGLFCPLGKDVRRFYLIEIECGFFCLAPQTETEIERLLARGINEFLHRVDFDVTHRHDQSPLAKCLK